tara:strand:+ start:1402 stop:1773 length:372 start_codon:yes stop_codon:yes gene_type:complete
MKRTARMSEAALQEQVVNVLRSYAHDDVCWWAVPNGEQRSRMTGARLKRQGVIAGAADLMLLDCGKLYCLELKTEVGKQSAVQEKFAGRIETAGGEYICAYGLKQALEELWRIGVLKREIVFR